MYVHFILRLKKGSFEKGRSKTPLFIIIVVIIY